MTIPRIIHQIWIGDQTKRPDALMETWRDMNPSCEYVLWTEENLANEKFVNQDAIDKMPELNGKCNIMRYELLFKYGGFSVDADSECVNTLDDFFFTDSDRFSCWENEKKGFSPESGIQLVASGFQACGKNDGLMKLAIEELSDVDFTKGLRSWQTCGNNFFSQLIEKYEADFPMKIYPSWYFIPQYGNGEIYKGKDKIYAKHYWGSTFNSYGEKLNDKNLRDSACQKRERQNSAVLQGIRNRRQDFSG